MMVDIATANFEVGLDIGFIIDVSIVEYVDGDQSSYWIISEGLINAVTSSDDVCKIHGVGAKNYYNVITEVIERYLLLKLEKGENENPESVQSVAKNHETDNASHEKTEKDSGADKLAMNATVDYWLGVLKSGNEDEKTIAKKRLTELTQD